jgi:hypothetical protein
MDLSTFIVAVFCLVDDRIENHRIRQRGPSSTLSDSEVLTIEIVGALLGLDTDKGTHLFFRRHYGEWFPRPRAAPRPTLRRRGSLPRFCRPASRRRPGRRRPCPIASR